MVLNTHAQRIDEDGQEYCPLEVPVIDEFLDDHSDFVEAALDYFVDFCSLNQ